MRRGRSPCARRGRASPFGMSSLVGWSRARSHRRGGLACTIRSSAGLLDAGGIDPAVCADHAELAGDPNAVLQFAPEGSTACGCARSPSRGRCAVRTRTAVCGRTSAGRAGGTPRRVHLRAPGRESESLTRSKPALTPSRSWRAGNESPRAGRVALPAGGGARSRARARCGARSRRVRDRVARRRW